MRIWAYTRAKEKIKNQVTFTALPNASGLEDIVATACERLKLPRPLILTLHEADFDRFSFAVFKRDHFVEDIQASELQIRKLAEEKPMTLQILHEADD
ncbi:MAG: hypothetical protein FWD16_08075 [Clostridia bacterium]|nr:hypothetical protein [Clostridia bacterium]